MNGRLTNNHRGARKSSSNGRRYIGNAPTMLNLYKGEDKAPIKRELSKTCFLNPERKQIRPIVKGVA